MNFYKHIWESITYRNESLFLNIFIFLHIHKYTQKSIINKSNYSRIRFIDTASSIKTLSNIRNVTKFSKISW